MSFYDFVCPRQHIRRNREADLLCRLKVNDEFKLRCLLHWQISRFGSFQYLVHVNSRTPIQVIVLHPIGHEATLINKLLLELNSRQPVSARKLDDSLSFGQQSETRDLDTRAD